MQHRFLLRTEEWKGLKNNMSNPTVFELNKSTIRDNIFFIEDNIGESIHFHIGLVRFDLSMAEFSDISSTLINILNEQVAIEGFDLKEQDEYFLERIAASIPYITTVEEDVTDIGKLKYRYETAEGKIVETAVMNTPVYQYYSGNNSIIDEYVFPRDIWQSKEDMLEQAKQKRTTTIYVDRDNVILDGYKSICAELASGNTDGKVKVKRIIFAEDKLPSVILQRERKKW